MKRGAAAKPDADVRADRDGVPVLVIRRAPLWAQTPAGRLAMVAVFSVLLAATRAVAWPGVSLVLALTSILPSWRRVIVGAAAVVAIAFAPPVDLVPLQSVAAGRGAGLWISLWPLAVAPVLALGLASVHLVRRYPKSFFGRRPVLCLVLLLTAALVVAADGPLRGLAWFFVAASAMALGSYVWFFAYAASESRLRGAPPAIAQLGYWRPFWGFSNVPLGKGAAYLERVEARDAEELGVAQRRGLRLMVWATVSTFALHAIQYAVYVPHGTLGGIAGTLFWWLPPDGLPPIAALLEVQSVGASFPISTRWASVIAEFVLSLLHMMAWGHAIIATCRMAGYNAAPNTDWAVTSTSIAEFYNRYYFYFKELLATFFFYPAYLRWFRGSPKLRLFVATLVAAGFGNFLFHFYRDSHEILRLGYWNALAAYRVYACYALALGTAIAISQMRLLAHHRRPPAGVRRARAVAGVLLFYCLLGVLDVRTEHGIGEYAALYASLILP